MVLGKEKINSLRKYAVNFNINMWRKKIFKIAKKFLHNNSNNDLNTNMNSNDDQDIVWLKQLLNHIYTWMIKEEIMFSNPSASGVGQIVPFSLTPCPIPYEQILNSYSKSRLITDIVNELHMEYQWMISHLQNKSSGDTLENKLIQIADHCRALYPSKNGLSSDLKLILLRIDYMIEKNNDTYELKLIELNTIALSLIYFATKTNELQRYLVRNLKQNVDTVVPRNTSLAYLGKVLSHSVHCYYEYFRELHKSLRILSNSFIITVSKYNPFIFPLTPVVSEKKNMCILLIIHPQEYNCYDINKIKEYIESVYKIPVVIKSFEQLYNDYTGTNEFNIRKMHTYCISQNKEVDVIINTNHVQSMYYVTIEAYENSRTYEVALVYYRTGYNIEDYIPREKAWFIRELLEISFAVKCPDVFTQLAGFKTIQANLSSVTELSSSSLVDKYNQIKEINVDQICLQDKANPLWSTLINDAIQNPNNYVLKPNKEGGSHNIYGQDIVQTLCAIKNDINSENMVLMKKINPYSYKTLHVFQNKFNPTLNVQLRTAVSELGIYMALFKNPKNSFYFYGDYLLRAKDINVLEGGVCCGAAFIDNYFIENHK